MNSYKPEGSLISTLSNQEYIGSREGLEKALRDQVILEAPVTLCDSNFDLHVALGGHVRGILPRDEVQFSPDSDPVKDIAVLTRVGKSVCFKVTGFKQENGRTVALLSRRAAQRECLLNYTSALIPGDIIPARITHLENYGAFVDIGCGLISLLSIDCISVSRINHPGVRLSVGDHIFTVVKSIDERGRIYVSERELLGSWEQNAALFKEGQTVRGVVRSVEDYGIFVELTPNLAGLAERRDNIFQNQIAAVFIKAIIPEKMKIKLIIIDVQDPPAKRHPDPVNYFIDPNETMHLDRWQYSPSVCPRVIASSF